MGRKEVIKIEGYFIFKGINSKDYGISISDISGITRAQRRVEEVNIPGRSGVLYIDEGEYDGYIISIECGKRGVEYLDAILSWLDGSGDLILSIQKDKIYKARVVNKIEVKDIIYLYNRFLIQFSVFPFKYSANESSDFIEINSIGKDHIIFNKGSFYSRPIISIWGSGNIEFNINKEEYRLKDISGNIVIDSEILEVYRSGDKLLNANNKFEAIDFPKFNVGENIINFSSKMGGSIEKIEITPRWRWL